MKRIILLLLAITSISIYSQKNLYFGQTPPSLTPVKFAPELVSTDKFEFCGVFTPDGKEYFFTRRNTHSGSANRILYTSLKNGKWSKPVLAPFTKDVFEFEPTISPDGNTIYFYSDRTENKNPAYTGSLWKSEKINGKWSSSRHLESQVNFGFVMSVSQAKNGNLYFSGNYKGKRGLFVCKKVDGKEVVTALPDNVNSQFFAHPFIAPDESYLLMDGQPSGRGKPELFVSFKTDDNKWSDPIKFGSKLNATKTEFGASVSHDGKYMFFHRRTDGNGDIYWVSSEVIKDLKLK